jgi:homoserine dehydrogenase
LRFESEINVALLGFGNVGRAFARYAEQAASEHGVRVLIRAIADSSGGLLLDSIEQVASLLAHKEAGRAVKEFAPASAVYDARDFIRLLPQTGIQVLIESLPTSLADGQPALDLIASALAQGTSVVTVDKGPLVYGFERLSGTAQAGGALLGYSGTTGVTAPEEISGERVIEIRGVLNGTTNYILTEMQRGATSFGEALAVAQAEGIAEPDPSLDVEGWDTASKVLILANALMGARARIGDVSRIGIGPETESLIQAGRASGRVVRLVGRARIWQGRVRVSVAPKLLDAGSPFYSVSGTSKAALFKTKAGAEVLSLARSGRDAISRTIMEDVIKIAKAV